MPPPTIAIIGAGFTGTVLSIWLQSAAPAGSRIYLIERSGNFGPGLAYSSRSVNHLLNAPVGRMSAFPDVPLDFFRWMQGQYPSLPDGSLPTENAFVPRHYYGDYLQNLLKRAMRADHPSRIELVHEQVVSVEEDAAGVALQMASGVMLTADAAVLAIGNLPSQPLHQDSAILDGAGMWRASPWQPDAFTDLKSSASVQLIGTGLSMVDAVLFLLDSGHAGQIHALSRHGLLPRQHARELRPAAGPRSPLPEPLVALTRHVRREAEHANRTEGNWRQIMDALRPASQEIWRGLSAGDQARFRRHLCTFWDVHRHRMAPQIAERIAAAQASGQLRVHAGRLARMQIEGGCARIDFDRREGGDRQSLLATRVINCTGPCADITRSPDPLTQSLLSTGTARADPLRLGLDVTSADALIGRSGIPSRRLFALGPPTKGAWWEITAVPEIRLRCRHLAHMLGELLSSDLRPSAHDGSPVSQRTYG